MGKEVEYRVLLLQEPKRLFRGVHAERDLVDSMRSNYERGVARNPAELRSTVLHMAVSMFDSAEMLRAMLRRFPRNGTHIATVDLQPEMGVCVADTGSLGHWSVWGRADERGGFVTDVSNI